MPNFNITDGLTAYRNSSWLKSLQYEFLSDKKPAGCSRCWSDEEVGIESKRQRDYRLFTDHLDNLSLKQKDFSIVAVAFNNLCNLACRICGPWASSSWVTEEKKIDPNTTATVFDWHTNPAHIDDLYEYSKNAKVIHIIGGEPFLTSFKEHLVYLNKFIDANNSNDISLHYTTNGTIFPDEKYINVWKKFKQVEIQISIDDTGRRFEYNRWPAKWNKVYANIKSFQQLEKENPTIGLSISYTVSAFTIFYAGDFAEWCEQESLPQPWFGIVSLKPNYHPAVYNDVTKKIIKDKLLSSKYDNVRQLCNYLDLEVGNFDDFVKEVKFLDNIRKQDFSLTFPELSINIQ